jgi:hypothetical protein
MSVRFEDLCETSVGTHLVHYCRDGIGQCRTHDEPSKRQNDSQEPMTAFGSSGTS